MWIIVLALFLLPFALALFMRFFSKFKPWKIAKGLEREVLEKLQELKKVSHDDYYVHHYRKEFISVERSFFLSHSFSKDKLEEAIAEYRSLLKGINFVIAVYSDRKTTNIPA